MLFACPHCQMSLQAEEGMIGQNVNCPGCGERIHVPNRPEPSTAPGLPAEERKRGGWPEADPSNVNVWIALGIGLVMMSVAVGILHLVRDSDIGQIFFTGGWVNYTEFVAFFWGLAIIFLKNKKNRRQRGALLLDVLPKSIAPQITAENVEKFIAHIYELPEHLRDSMMVNRIRKGLELFEARTSNSEVAGLLNAQSSVDANRIAGSYALLKVFLWSLPILGFVGTVLGLSFAMGGFGTADLTDINALKGAVSSITGGLASAFNCTLLGLTLSMLLIFPMSAMQKREEDCLTDIDAFCNENVLARLNDGGAAPAPAAAATAGVPAGFSEILREYTKTQQQFLADFQKIAESLQDVTTVVQYAAKQLDERSAEHQQRVEERFGAALKDMLEQSSGAVAKSARGVEKYVGSLVAGIDSLNKALATLGEKKIVIERPPRRGWFS
jgi:flagellar motor component MotA/DNA-directed RNA polymerase subunit RPC12/RpoP